MKLLDKMHKYKKTSSSFLKCRKNMKNLNPKFSVTSHGKPMILSNSDIFKSKKPNFIRKEEENGLLSSLGIKASLNKNYFS